MYSTPWEEGDFNGQHDYNKNGKFGSTRKVHFDKSNEVEDEDEERRPIGFDYADQASNAGRLYASGRGGYAELRNGQDESRMVLGLEGLGGYFGYRTKRMFPRHTKSRYNWGNSSRNFRRLKRIWVACWPRLIYVFVGSAVITAWVLVM
jgi:hypothetical protein